MTCTAIIEAARRIDSSIEAFSCHALEYAVGPSARMRYEKLFKPEHTSELHPSWFEMTHISDSWGFQWGARGTTRKARECRVLALCLFAAMVEAGDA